MHITANHVDSKNDQGLQLGLREQQNTTLVPSQRPISTKDQTSESHAGQQGSASRAHVYSSYFSKKAGAYLQAIRAYQASARFEENSEGTFNSLGSESVLTEEALTDVIREEPSNSAAWSDLGLLYHTQGKRDKVSAIYQILQELNIENADAFATQLRLHEKMLFSVG